MANISLKKPMKPRPLRDDRQDITIAETAKPAPGVLTGGCSDRHCPVLL